MSGPPLYRLSSVAKVYKQKRGPVFALRDVDLTINDGEFLVLRGPSGAGKSTLLNILAGICLPTEGEVLFQDKRLYSKAARFLGGLRRYRNRFIGFVFQDFQLMGGLTARQNIELPLYFRKGTLEVAAKDRIEELAGRLGIDDKLSRLPHQLSGGESQRVAIARALVHEPAVVFADEPTGNLDGKTESNILKIIAEERKRRNFLFIAASHSDKFIRKADRVVLVEDGRVSLK